MSKKMNNFCYWQYISHGFYVNSIVRRFILSIFLEILHGHQFKITILIQIPVTYFQY